MKTKSRIQVTRARVCYLTGERVSVCENEKALLMDVGNDRLQNKLPNATELQALKQSSQDLSNPPTKIESAA